MMSADSTATATLPPKGSFSTRQFLRIHIVEIEEALFPSPDLLRDYVMLARNSRGFLVSLLSPAPTATEPENGPQSREIRDGSQDVDMKEADFIQGEEHLEELLEEEVRVLNEEEHAKDIKWSQNLSDVALQSAEHEEVCPTLARAGSLNADGWSSADLDLLTYSIISI